MCYGNNSLQSILVCVRWLPNVLPWVLGNKFAFPIYGVALWDRHGRNIPPSIAGLHQTR